MPRLVPKKDIDLNDAELLAGWRKLLGPALVAAKRDIENAADAYTKFLPAFYAARDQSQWVLHGESGTLTFLEACLAVNREPEAVCQLMFHDVPRDLRLLLAQGVNYSCPFCGGKR